MRYLTLGEVVELHQRLLAQTGGATGIRDMGLLESALPQPRATFDGIDLHQTFVDKAAALGFALVANRIILLLTETNASAMPPWKYSWY